MNMKRLIMLVQFFFFFFKQKTAYEMRISDWSSDVCSSDLALGIERPHLGGNSMGGWIALRFAIDYPDALRTLTLMNNAGVAGTNESELQKLAADSDYNPLVIANLEDADRLIAFVVHKPTFVPALLKPVIYRDALRPPALAENYYL